jgi:hypothetical protein
MAMLSRSVCPPVAQSVVWWISDWAAVRVQPGKVQPRSLANSARRCPGEASRLLRP